MSNSSNERYIKSVEDQNGQLREQLEDTEKQLEKYKLSCAHLREMIKSLKNSYFADMENFAKEWDSTIDKYIVMNHDIIKQLWNVNIHIAIQQASKIK